MDEWRSEEYIEEPDEWSYPTKVFIDGKAHNIRNKCDYRVVLDCICALNDVDLTDDEKIRVALYIFYENILEIDDIDEAVKGMFAVINGGEESEQRTEEKPKLMDWEHDFQTIAPPINRVLGYDIRSQHKYTHWYTFLGGYMEIGDCTFANIVRIRSKIANGERLDKTDIKYYREHRKAIDLPKKITAEEQELLDGEW